MVLATDIGLYRIRNDWDERESRHNMDNDTMLLAYRL
jgi:hypothetical protein